MNINPFVLAAIVAAGLVAPLIWLFFTRRAAHKNTEDARERAHRVVANAEREAETKLREADLAAKEKLLEARSEFEKIAGQRRLELDGQERELAKREDEFSRQQVTLHKDLEELARRDEGTRLLEARIERREGELAELLQEERGRLEQVSGLTAQQAKDELSRVMESDARVDAAHLVKRIEDEAHEHAQREAQRIIATAIERSASDYVSETTVSVVILPNDDMKGRIIGREGRNIRALEMTTGVDLIVDDTPEAVILSGFDPFRREIARVALERLISDGRIHPARIESVVEKVKDEFEEIIQKAGEAALLELDLADVHPELVKLLGRLQYRTSYGQNVLNHSKEVAFLCSLMAAELKVDSHVAKRAGLFHDIGKAVDREFDGTHLQIGMDLLRKFGEGEQVVHAMSCHHGDYDPETVEAVLVTSADALSAARPGARREILETYVKRLTELEDIASSFKGVQKTFAIQAGREVRIIVDSEKLSDEESIWLSRDVAKRVEAELTYPGQIKVTVIRETRSIEYAR
ncbi:MAG: ribonuclease Y [Acidobacteriota bacterium]|nr:ribonuclease Y [Acidobacteriota bacterium]